MFKNKLKELRKEKGLKQREIANFLKTSTGTIGNYEKGNREPDIKTLIKIAEHFNVSVDYLIGRPAAQQEITLTETEQKIIKNYRAMPEELQIKLQAYLQGLTDSIFKGVKELQYK